MLAALSCGGESSTEPPPPSSPAAIAKSSGDAQSATAGSAVAVAPAVLITDDKGNPVVGTTVTFAVASGGGSITGATPTTNTSGVATLGSWTLGTVAAPNSNTVTATVTTSAGTLSSTFTASTIAGPAAALTKSAGDAQSATAGSAIATAPAVLVTDAHNNPVSGQSVTFAVTAGGGTVTGGTQTTNAAGVATVGGWTLGTAAGAANTLSATAGALTATFAATATVGAAASIAVHAGDSQGASAGTAVAVAPAVLITDSHGNPVAGVSVTFAVASGGGTVSGAAQTTAASGIATVGGWTLGTASGTGNNRLTAAAGSLSVEFIASATPGALHHFRVEEASGTDLGAQIAGTPFSIRVVAQDASDNTVTSFTGTVSLTSNRTGSAGLTTSAPFSAGVLANHSITLTQMGNASTITATRTGGAESGASAPFTVESGAVHHFVVEAQGGGAIGAQTAGVPFNVRVVAQDANNNTATTFAGTVDVRSNRTGSAGLATSGAFTAGVLASHSITLTQSGSSATITATSGIASGTSNAFTVNAGALHHFTVAAAGGGTIGTQTAGSAFNVAITAQDASNNTVTGFTGTVSLTSNRTGSAGLTTSAPFSAGVLASHAVTLTQPGAASIVTATRTGGAESGASAPFTVESGAVHHFVVEAQGGGAIGAQTAGVPFNVRIVAEDANGNIVTSFTGTVDVGSSRFGSAGLGTSAPFVAGVLASHAMTLTESGPTATITATRTSGSETGTSAAFPVNPGGIDHFDVEATGGGAIATQAVGTSFNVRIVARDASNNVASGFTGAGNTVSVTSNRTASAGLTTTPTFNNGVLASHAITLTQTGAGATITATRTAGGAETGTSNAFTVTAGPLHHFLVEAAGGGSVGTQLQNGAFNIRITAQDQANNTVTAFGGAGSTVDVTSTGALSAGSGTTPAFVAGVLASHALTVNNTGSVIVTATRTGGTESGATGAFTVVPPPALLSSVPASGATGVSPASTIALTFSRAVTATTSSFTIQCPAATFSLPYTVTGSPGTTITLDPSADLPAGTSCQVATVAAQITDAFGFHPGANTTVSFTTALTANADSYPETVIGNVQVNSANAAVPFSVTANDVLDAGAVIASYGSTVGSTNQQTANGGALVMTTSGPDRGTFTYNPPVGFSGVDNFSYRISSNGSTSDATVTFTVSAPVWFVDNASTCSSSCDGRLSHPFTSLASFQASNNTGGPGRPADNQVVFLHQSAIDYVGPVTPRNGQKLVGQDATTSLAAIYGASPGPSSTPFPAMNPGDGTFVRISGASGGVLLSPLGASATLRGFTIATSGGTALASGPSFGFLTFANGTTEAPDVTIDASGGGAMSLASGIVSGMLANVSSTGGTNGLNLVSMSGSLTMTGGALSGASGSTVSITGPGGAAITYGGSVIQTGAAPVASIFSRNTGSVTLSGNLSCSASCTGLSVTNNSGGNVAFSGPVKTLTGATLSFNSGAFITFLNGGLAVNGGFNATGGGTLTVTGLGNSINAGAAQAMNLDGMTVGTTGISFASVTSSGGVNNLKFFNVTGTGSPVSLNGGSISGATQQAFLVINGNASITYGGNLTSSSAFPGVDVSGYSVGTVTLSGSTKTISSGTVRGVRLFNNVTGTVSFTNGGLNVTTTTANAFDVTGGGTVTVSGPGNTLNATAGGVALNVQSSTIGSGGLTFQSISSSGGAPNGIVLSNTGSTAGLTVTGAGGICTTVTPTCTGGRIQGTNGPDGFTTGIGIYLNNTRSPSFARMLVDGTHQNFGLYGDAVTNLTIDNVVMNGTYGTNAGALEGTVSLLNLAGTGTVTGGDFRNGISNNVRVRTSLAPVTLNGLTFTGTTFGLTQTNANAALQVVSDAGTSTVTVNGSSTFLGAHRANVEYLANGGTPNLVLQGNSFANGQASGSTSFNHVAILAGVAGADATGNVGYTIANNTMTGSRYAAIYVDKDRGTQAITGSITGNTIGDGTAGSGALATGAILFRHAASGSHRALIDQNFLRNYSVSAGIQALFAQPTGGALPNNGSMHLTITRNTISNPNAGGFVDGVRLTPNTSSGSHTMCVNFGNTGANVLTSSFTAGAAPFAIGYVVGAAGGFFKMQGLGTFDNAGVLALASANNLGVAGGAVSLAGVTIASSSNNAVGAACNLP